MVALIIIILALGGLAYLDLRRDNAFLRAQVDQQMTFILATRRELNNHKQTSSFVHGNVLGDIARIDEDVFALQEQARKFAKKARK